MTRLAEVFWRALAVSHVLTCPSTTHMLGAHNVIAGANTTAVAGGKGTRCVRIPGTVALHNARRRFAPFPHAALADADTNTRGRVAPSDRWIGWVWLAALQTVGVLRAPLGGVFARPTRETIFARTLPPLLRNAIDTKGLNNAVATVTAAAYQAREAFGAFNLAAAIDPNTHGLPLFSAASTIDIHLLFTRSPT